jgi:hypothetical protein
MGRMLDRLDHIVRRGHPGVLLATAAAAGALLAAGALVALALALR